ncbi:hypothetical protein BJX76DRAFT_358987 [Aspergillus varians]
MVNYVSGDNRDDSLYALAIEDETTHKSWSTPNLEYPQCHGRNLIEDEYASFYAVDGNGKRSTDFIILWESPEGIGKGVWHTTCIHGSSLASDIFYDNSQETLQTRVVRKNMRSAHWGFTSPNLSRQLLPDREFKPVHVIKDWERGGSGHERTPPGVIFPPITAAFPEPADTISLPLLAEVPSQTKDSGENRRQQRLLVHSLDRTQLLDYIYVDVAETEMSLLISQIELDIETDIETDRPPCSGVASLMATSSISVAEPRITIVTIPNAGNRRYLGFIELTLASEVETVVFYPGDEMRIIFNLDVDEANPERDWYGTVSAPYLSPERSKADH